MTRRLIIQHGERVTRHDITDRAITVGRDPSCDLFFADHRLSRRHARMEPGPEGVKLVDLGSRNGTWVNEEKIEEHLLKSEDVIRLGGLRITFEEERPAFACPPGQEATVMLAGSPSDASDAGTVMLGAAAPPATGEPPRGSPDSTVLLSEKPPAAAEIGATVPETTVPPAEEAGTVVFRERLVRADEDTGTRAIGIPMAPPAVVPPPAEEEEAPEPVPVPTEEAVPVAEVEEVTPLVEEPRPIAAFGPPLPTPPFLLLTADVALVLGGLALLGFLLGILVRTVPLLFFIAVPILAAATWGAMLVFQKTVPPRFLPVSGESAPSAAPTDGDGAGPSGPGE